MLTISQITIRLIPQDRQFKIIHLGIADGDGIEVTNVREQTQPMDRLPAFEADLTARGYVCMSNRDAEMRWWQKVGDDSALPEIAKL